jgi:hypothetical protein
MLFYFIREVILLFDDFELIQVVYSDLVKLFVLVKIIVGFGEILFESPVSVGFSKKNEETPLTAGEEGSL